MDDRMHEHDVWRELPNTACYREFVKGELGLLSERDQDPFFPVFHPDVDQGIATDLGQRQEIRAPGHQIILCSKWGHDQISAQLKSLPRVLVVELSLTSVPRAFQDSIRNGETSLLVLELLVFQALDVYLGQLAILPEDKQKLLCNDREWLNQLQWLYARYPPAVPKGPAILERQLRDWKETGVPNAASLRDTLEKLAGLVTYSVTYEDFRGERHTYQRFERVAIVVNDRGLAPKAIGSLLAELEEMVDLLITDLHFKLFIDQVYQSLVKEKSWAGYGLSVIALQWTEDELRHLIRRRIFSHTPHAITRDNRLLPEYCLGDLLVRFLDPKAYTEVEDRVVDAAQGSPFHALCLTRGVVAACAGCWPQQYQVPLSSHDIKTLISAYRSHCSSTP